MATSAWKFVIVGAIATLLHVTVAIGLIEAMDWHPSLANGIAFIIANFSSYVVNTRWSFQATINMRSWQRFTMVSSLALLLTIVLSWMVAALGGPYLLGIILTVTIIPMLGYISHKNFTYR